MTDFNGISERTKLYLEYEETIEAVRSAYEDDRGTILEALVTEFFGTEGINKSTWRKTIAYAGNYVKLYKPIWYTLEKSANMEFEPHVRLNPDESEPDTPDDPYIRVRFDVEGRESQTVRDAMLNRLGDDGKEQLESRGFRWFNKEESPYRFISKVVPLSSESEGYDPIVATNNEIQRLLEIIEEPADAIAREY